MKIRQSQIILTKDVKKLKSGRGGGMTQILDQFKILFRGDRRNSLRSSAWHLIKIIQQDGFKADGIGNLRDISARGLQFTTDKQFSPETRLSMVVNLASEGYRIPIRVKIIWVRKQEQGYLSGAVIDYISPRDRGIVESMMKTAA